MEAEIQRIRSKAGPKINAILATRHFFDTTGLVQQYKSHVLCLLEGSSIAIRHAAISHLETLDSLQNRFLREIGLDEKEAFLNPVFNLAPLQLRRDIGALGLLHKIQLGEAHEDFETLLPKLVHPYEVNTRRNFKRHGKQFFEQSGQTD